MSASIPGPPPPGTVTGPVHADPLELVERGRRQMAAVMMKVVIGSLVAVMGLALLDPSNDPAFTLQFYAGPLVFLAVVHVFGRRRPALVGWTLGGLLIAASCAAMVLDGGQIGASAMGLPAAVLISAALAGRRSAIAYTVISSALLTGVALAETFGLMPPRSTPAYSAANAWSAIQIPLVVSVFVMLQSQRLLEKALQAAQRHGAERDAAQRELVQAQKLDVVGRLAASVAHDFNNLLAAILASHSLMAATREFDEESADAIRAAAKRGAVLTQRLLTFGRPATAEPQVIDAAAQARELAPVLDRLVGDGVRIAWDMPRAVPVYIDRLAFEQILLNLVINAKEAVSGDGALRVQLARDAAEGVLVVADNGPGVPPDLAARVFEPFFTTKVDGTGLGLSTVCRLVAASHGRISLDNSAQGATFTIRWPLATDPAVDAVDVPVNVPTTFARHRVLLVDDHDLMRRATEAVLRSRGFVVHAASDPLEAMSWLEGAEVDLLITDVQMYGMLGTELAERVRERSPDLPVLLISGTASLSNLPPRSAFLAKPFGADELFAAIGALLAPAP